jgi:hypothetical protein
MGLLRNYVFLLFILQPILGFAQSRPAISCKALFSNSYTLASYSNKAFNIMMKGSANLSRTKVKGMTFFGDKIKVPVSEVAERNFEKAAQYVLDNHFYLEINLETAKILNRILTQDLVPEEHQGNYQYRTRSFNIPAMDSFYDHNPEGFYNGWLNSAQAKTLYETDPVALAEIIHNAVAALDAFPDGNGRLSRLFSDLVLIKNNLPVAYYTSMEDYFARGNSRANVDRATRVEYYREAVSRGQKELFELQ